eukprot:766126-Hanusia_phi.AAC.1
MYNSSPGLRSSFQQVAPSIYRIADPYSQNFSPQAQEAPPLHLQFHSKNGVHQQNRSPSMSLPRQSSLQPRLQQHHLPDVVDDDEGDFDDDIILADAKDLEDSEYSNSLDSSSTKNDEDADGDMVDCPLRLEDKETLVRARKFGQDARAKRLAKKVEIDKHHQNQSNSQSSMLESLKALRDGPNSR